MSAAVYGKEDAVKRFKVKQADVSGSDGAVGRSRVSWRFQRGS